MQGHYLEIANRLSIDSHFHKFRKFFFFFDFTLIYRIITYRPHSKLKSCNLPKAKMAIQYGLFCR